MAYRYRSKKSSYQRERDLRRDRKKHCELFLEALSAYSGGRSSCMCECGCGELNSGFLTLDHVNNDGQSHRAALNGFRREGMSAGMLARLKRRGWPTNPPIRVLCFNCNCGRQKNAGRCPRLGLVKPGDIRRALSSKLPDVKDEPSLFDGI